MPMDLSAMGSQDQKFQGSCSWCANCGHMSKDCRKKTEYLQNNKKSGWLGSDDKGKKQALARHTSVLTWWCAALSFEQFFFFFTKHREFRIAASLDLLFFKSHPQCVLVSFFRVYRHFLD